MKHDVLQQAAEYTQRRHQKKRWQKVVTGLAAVVVFCTTYALILPAITMEKQCELPEHIHTQACYAQVTSVEKKIPVCTAEDLNIHQHSADCYNSDDEIVCGYADFVIHQHDSSCYDENGNLWCPLPIIEPHTHGESCWTVPETEPVHEHTDECYEWDQGETLICGQEEREGHIHSEEAGCYSVESTLTCQTPEGNGHQHEESCFDENSDLICGKNQGDGGHTHGESCYQVTKTLTCEISEDPGHQHSSDCYENIRGELVCIESTELPEPDGLEPTERSLTCEKAEIIPHEHTSDCFDDDGNLICGKIQILEHRHTDGCFETVEESVNTETPICGMIEHIHTDACNVSLWNNTDDGTLLNGGPQTDDEVRVDFSGYVETVTYKDATYNPETDQVEVSFKLTFAIGSAAMHPSEVEEQHNFVYALPLGVTIPDSMLDKTYTGRDTSGAEGFTYEFVKNDDGTYSILINFIHDYVKDKDNFEGYINFSAYAGATDEKESEYKYTFADDHVIDIKPEEIKHPEGESMHYNIAVEKSASNYNYDENKITYKITVDSTKGTPNPLNLTDVLKLNGLSVDHVQLGSVVVEDRHDQWNMVYGSQKDVSGCAMNYDSASGEITMSLPGLGTGCEGNGQRYIITYDVYLNEPTAGSQYTVGNKATVSGTDSTKGETIKDSGETTTTVNKGLDIYKSGTYDKETRKITWTITVNNNQNNIAGSTLTDDMFASIDKSTVKFEPSNGIAWDGDALKFSGVNGDTNDQTYTITYTTPLPEDLTFTDGVAVVDNKATVTPPSGEKKETEASVTIDKSVDVGKKGEYDKSQNRIKWTITVNKNENSLKDTVLTDTMFNQVKPSDLTVTPGTDGMNIETNDDGTIKQITFNESAGNQTYTITYYTDVPAPEEGKESVEVKNGTTVTPPDLPPKTDEETVVVNKTVDFSKIGAYDKINDTITWTITVNRNGNDLTGKVLTDSMFSQFTDKSQITITPGNGYEWIGDSLKFTAVENGVNNQTYTITYTTKSGVNVNQTGTVSNTVGLDGKETTTEVPVDRTIAFDKENGSYDANNKCIWWNIYVNSNYQNIAGYTLTDTMFGEMVEGTLQVLSDNKYPVAEAEESYTIFKTDGKVSSILFNGVGTTGVNTQKYLIKYATPASPKWDSYTVTNTATIDPPGDTPPVEDTGEATVPGEGSVVKKCESGILGENGLLEMTWKMEVKVPSTGLPSGTIITDTLKDGQWMTFQQIQEWGSMIGAKDESGNYATGVNYWWPAGETYTIKFTATDGTEVSYADIVSGGNDSQNKKYTGFTITFSKALSAETYGGKTLWIQYKSYADVSSVADTQKYNNTISIKPPDGTSKESTASYDYRKAGVYKTDGNGNKESTPFTTTDGVLTWKVRVRTSKDCNQLTVVDTLPQGVTLTGIKLDNTNLPISGTQISCDSMWSGNNKLIVSGTIEENTAGDKTTLTLSSVDSSGNSVPIPYRSEFYIYYTCKINPGILNNMNADQATSFTNTVTAWQDDTEFPSDSHTQEVKYDKTGTATKVVEKSGEWVNDSRLLDYSVVLNPAGDDLVEGKDTLTLTDTLEFWTNSSTASLIDTALLPGSVKLYEAYYDDAGDLVKGDEIRDWTWKVETKVEDKGWGVQHLSIITAAVPDSTPMIFEYAYNVWLPDGSTTDKAYDWEKPQVKNTVALTGVSDGSSSEESKIEWKEMQTEAGITYDHTLVLYKVEEGNYGKTLPGAEFTLYDASKNQIGIYTTDSNGSFIIKWDETGKTFEHNKLYYLVETKAPEGYLMPQQPVEYCFYFSSTEDTLNRLPDVIPDGAIDLSVEADQIYCENEKTTTSITVDKKWLSFNGDDITSSKGGSISFGLYQIASTTKPEEGSGDSGGTSGSNNVTFTLRNSYNHNSSMGPTTGTNVSIGDEVEITIAFTLTNINQYWQPEVNVISGLAEGWTSFWQFESPAVLKITGTVNAAHVLIDSAAGLEGIPTFATSVTKPAAPPSEPDSPAGTLYGTYTIGENHGGWRLTIDNLPKQGVDGDGNIVYYTYYIVENAGNYSTSYGNNDGIASGTITVTNTESDTPGYVMPETGGAGTALYTAGGALMTLVAGILLYIQNKRRKEETASS